MYILFNIHGEEGRILYRENEIKGGKNEFKKSIFTFNIRFDLFCFL
jgi:hypothetical protein